MDCWLTISLPIKPFSGANLPSEFEMLVTNALEKNPDDRESFGRIVDWIEEVYLSKYGLEDVKEFK